MSTSAKFVKSRTAFWKQNRRLTAAVLAAFPVIGLENSLASANTPIFLQPGGYTQNFNSSNIASPAGFIGATAATTTSLGTPATFAAKTTVWNSGTGQFTSFANPALGSTATAAAQNASTDRIFGYQQTAASDPGGAIEVEVLTTGYNTFTLGFDFDEVNPQPRTTIYTVDYGIGTSPTSFTPLGTITANNNSSTTSFGSTTVSFAVSSVIDNQAAPVWFRIAALNTSTGSGNRDGIGIDNFNLSYSGTGPNVTILSFNSAGTGDSNFSSSSLDVNFLNGSTPSSFATGNIVNFNTSSVGNVVVAAAGVLPAAINVGNDTGTYNFSGGSMNDSSQYIGTVLTKTGLGTLEIASKNGFTGGANINAGVLQVDATGNLGTGPLSINSATATISATAVLTSSSVNVTNGGDLVVTTGASLGTTTLILGAGGTVQTSSASTTFPAAVTFNGSTGTLDTGTGTVTIAGQFQVDTFTKIGTGSLILSGTTTNATNKPSGTMTISAGTVVIAAVDTSSTGFNLPSTGIGGFKVLSGTTLQLANIGVGLVTNKGNSPGFIDLYPGGTLLGTGNSYYENQNISFIAGNASAPAVTETLATLNATDVLSLHSAVSQFFDTTVSGTTSAMTNVVVHVTGPGRVELRDGGVFSKSTFGGDWSVDGGILQVGPFLPNAAASNASSSQTASGGPYGQPLNALGFKEYNPGGNADPDLPNRVTVNTGATLAVAIDQVNTNPNITTFTVEPIPNYLRNGLTLSGGTVAATGQEASFSATNGSGEGISDGILVNARFGGDITIGAGNSKVFLGDPTSLTSTVGRNVEFVAGGRQLPNSGDEYFLQYSDITNTLTWSGNLEVSPGVTTGGSFDLARQYGTITVSAPSTLTVDANATTYIGKEVLPGGTAVTTDQSYLDPLTDSTVSTASSVDTTKSVAVTVAGTLNYAARTGNAATATVSTSTVAALPADTGFLVMRVSSLTLASTGTVKFDTATSHANRTVFVTGGLTFGGTAAAPTGLLDLGGNDLIVVGGSLSNVSSAVARGYNLVNGAKFDGLGGITSSVAAADTSHLSALGVISNSQNGSAVFGSNAFDGLTPNASDILVKYTYFGDANLDGKVDGSDYSLIDAGYTADFNAAGSATGWYNGDFNYDGTVDGSDYALIDNAFNNQAANPLLAGSPNALTAEATAQVAGPTAVPEPASLGVVAVAGLLGLRRRRASGRIVR